MTIPCPDGGVYDRIERLERQSSADRVRWSQQERATGELRDDVSTLCDSVTRLSTTIKVATAIMGFLLALAGVIVPLWKG